MKKSLMIFILSRKKNHQSFVDPDISSEFAQRVYDGNSYVVQEMDAASNRGIDDIRLLKERAMMPPLEGKMAVYILDEVHMLTTEAFNALLKLLEEPPPHAVFILATTELHKIPSTIISRCSKIDFKKASIGELVKALKAVLDKENIKSEQKDLELIAKKADGSFRDAVKMLELVCQSGELNSENLEAMLGGDFEEAILDLFKAVLAKDAGLVMELIQKLRDENTDQKFFYQALFSFLHFQLLIALTIEPGEAFSSEKIIRFLLSEFLKADLAQSSPVSFLSLELKLLELIDRAGGIKIREIAIKPEKIKLEKIIVPKIINQVSSEIKNQYSSDLINKWQEFLDLVQQKNSSLAMILKSCKINSCDNAEVKVSVYYPFHKDQLSQPKHLDILEQCCLELLNFKPKFSYQIEKKQEIKQKSTSVKNLTQVATEALM